MYEPKVVQDATDEYRDEQNHIGNFVDDCLDLKGGDYIRVRASEMYEEYKEWCAETGTRWPKNIKDFKAGMEKYLVTYAEKNT